MAATDALTRLALFVAWDERCVWCQRPLFFDEMEVEHLLPKSLTGKDKDEALRQHDRPADFDLNSLENLAPSCGPCNRGKGKKLPPEAPIVSSLLEKARSRAPDIRRDAAAFATNRRIQNALPVVLEAARAGDADTLSRLREATQTLQVEYSESTGRAISRLSAVLSGVRGSGGALNASDPFFYYTTISQPSGAPPPALTPGTVMSILSSDDAMTNRIDVVPDDPRALESYGPAVTLTPTDDEAGTRAAELLHKALQEGTAVQIDEGLDLTFERLPPGLNDLVGQRMTGGTVELGEPERVRRPMPDWDAELTAVAADGRRSVRAVLRQAEEPPEGFDDALVGRFGGMQIAAKFRRHEGGGEIHWTFRHERDSSSVRDQVAALRFLAALSEGGKLVVTDRSVAGRRPPFELDVPQGVVSSQSRALVAFLEDLLVIEERTGATFELPRELSGGELEQIRSVASLIREGGRSITWSDATFRLDEAGVERLRAGGVLRVEQALSANVLGKTPTLGLAQIDIPAYEISDVRAAPDEPGSYDVTIIPPGGAAGDVFERLVKISGPSKRAKRQQNRKKKKHGRNR